MKFNVKIDSPDDDANDDGVVSNVAEGQEASLQGGGNGEEPVANGEEVVASTNGDVNAPVKLGGGSVPKLSFNLSLGNPADSADVGEGVDGSPVGGVTSEPVSTNVVKPFKLGGDVRAEVEAGAVVKPVAPGQVGPGQDDDELFDQFFGDDDEDELSQEEADEGVEFIDEFDSVADDTDSYFDDFFGDESELDAVEVGESGLDVQWADLLDDDEGVGLVGVGGNSTPAGVVGEASGVASEGAGALVGVKSKPVLDDDEVGALIGSDTVESVGGGAGGGVVSAPRVVEQGVFELANPLLDEDDEEFAPVGGGVKTVLTVPEPPRLSGDEQAVVDARARGEKAARAARQLKPASLDAEALEGHEGLDRHVAYEVRVDGSGREAAVAKRLKVRKPSVEVVESGKPEVASVEVVDASGRAKWSGKGEAGRLGPRQLAAFKNLNRARVDPHAEEVVREIFAKVNDPSLTPAEVKKAKKLANRAVFGGDQVRAGSRTRFTLKDREVLRFIGMFKYANAKHIARVHQVREETMLKRLYNLQDRGLVVKKELYGAKPIWYLTEGGLVCSGLEIPRVRESGLTYSMMPHQFVVNHTAGHLWGGGVNVLGLEDFPEKYRALEDGSLAVGETLVSEYEIQSSFATAKAANHRADVYRPAILDAMNSEFGAWKKAGGVAGGPSPEMVRGNEYMWTLFPPFALKLAYHVPDLVVKRPRNADGTPNSIAVEVELANKPLQSYERTLQAYKFDSMIYGKVVWVVKSRGAARKIQEAAKKIDLWASGRVGIVPIRTEDGIFKGKAEWTI